jgi:hypothetical protein
MFAIDRIDGGLYGHIRRSHPLAAGLIWAVLEPHQGYGPDVAHGSTSLTLSSPLPLADATPWGMLAANFDDTADRNLSYAVTYDAAPFTYGAFVRPDFGTAAARDAVARGNVGATNGHFSLGADTASLRYRMAVRLGGTIYSAIATTNFTARKWVFIAGSYDGADLRLFVSDLGMFTTAVNVAYTASGQNIRLGMRGVAATARWMGGIGSCFGWSRVLSEPELVQVSQDLYVSWLTGWEPPSRVWAAAETGRVSGQATLPCASRLSAEGRVRLFSGAVLRGVGAILASGGLAGGATLIQTDRSACSETARRIGLSDGSARIGAGEGVLRRGGKA